jgi:hypothetical protein
MLSPPLPRARFQADGIGSMVSDSKGVRLSFLMVPGEPQAVDNAANPNAPPNVR